MWEAAASEIVLAPKQTIRRGCRLPSSEGSGRNMPGQWPEWLTHITRGRADSTGASDWPPLAAGTLHPRGANQSRCGNASCARLAARLSALLEWHCRRTPAYTTKHCTQVGMPII